MEDNPLFKAPEELEMKICRFCGGYFIGNSFYDIERNPASEYLEAGKELVLEEIEVLQEGPTGLRFEGLDEAEGVDVSLKAEYKNSNTIKVDFEVFAKHLDKQNPPTQEGQTKIKIKETTCEICQKKESGYYEAILQIRGQNQIPENKITKIYHKLREKFSKNQNRQEFVTKIKEKHGGIDLYTSSAKLAKNLAQLLKKEYGAKIDESAKLIGQTKEGKEKYRVTVIARLPF